MSNKKQTSLIFAVAFVLIALVIVLYPSHRSQDICDINREGGCTIKGITFSIDPRPVTAMRENVFRARLEDPSMVPEGTDLALHLTMPGMEMGINRMRLKKIGPGRYSGKGVIPRCPSGQKLWRAAILDISARELASFHFEVE